MIGRLLVIITVLMLCAGLSYAAIVGDIDGNGKIDLAEAMYALQVSAGAYPDLEPSCQLNGKGAWASGTTYNECDVVTNDGAVYASIESHTAFTFISDSAYWVLLTQEGPQGPEGPEGPTGTFSVISTIRTSESDYGTMGWFVSDIASIACNYDEIITGGTCSSNSDNYNSKTTNLGVIRLCDIVGNSIIGGAVANYIVSDVNYLGPPIRVSAVCVKNGTESLAMSTMLATDVSSEVQTVIDEQRNLMILMQQKADSKLK